MHLPQPSIANRLRPFPSLRPSLLGATLVCYWVCVLPLTARAQPIAELETVPVSLTPLPLVRQAGRGEIDIAQGETWPTGDVLRVPERFGITFESGPQIGSGSAFGSFYGFFPFSQVAGQSTFYTEGRLNFATRAGDVGGNVRLGYRRLLPGDDLVLGGYIGWDIRETEFDNIFHQFGAGVDLQGQNWLVRLNGYLPVGDRQQEIESLRLGTFQGNQLFVTRTFQDAMAGFDLEGGYQLLDWEGGQLYGYIGPYFLTTPERGSVLGMRGRLLADVHRRYSAGLAVSTDSNFGTTVTLQLSARLDGAAARPPGETPLDSVVARLGQPVSRQETITLDRRVADPILAINPVTGEAWRFFHVTDGAVGGNGTVENPLGEVTDAVALANTTGNDVIYVDGGDRSGMGGFTLPANVQALSSGVTQFVALSVGGDVQLPGSGSGTLPLINGTVTMGDNSTLSGFQIATTADDADGVVANNVTHVTIDRNQISTTGDRAHAVLIRADGANIGNATISGNTISTTGASAHGIYGHGLNGATLGTVTIAGNTLSTTGLTAKGTYLRIRGNSTLSTATITGNSVTTSGDNNAFGIQVNSGTSTLTTATISGNTVTTTGSQALGIYVRAQNLDGTITHATISGNRILTTGNYGDGIVVTASGQNMLPRITAIHSATISGNTIATRGNYADGIVISTSNRNSVIGSATVTQNHILQAGANLVVIQVRNAGESVCIAEFSNNIGGTPNGVGRGGNAINFNPSAGTPGTINVVDFMFGPVVPPNVHPTTGSVLPNNVGFNDVVITNLGNLNSVDRC